MKKNEEYGLMIIWENARFCEEKILEDLKKRFQIIGTFEVEWTKSIFSQNLTRFYGENLVKNSFKEKHCGNGKFLLVILKDCNPLYKYRKTSKGKKLVNVNLFDSKELYRLWTGGGHKIHATNDMKELRHDIMLLLGMSIDDYLKKYSEFEGIKCIKRDIIGSNGWDSLEQVFYVLNETTNYVILRNFNKLPKEYQIGNHGDIDILCDNLYNLITILNAEKENSKKSRVRYIVNINSENVYFDFRYVNDNYYDKKWEDTILSTKIKKKCFYIPNSTNYKYSLLYHALVHKKNISDDYKAVFNSEFLLDSIPELTEELERFMDENKYEFVDPIDLSVYYNEKVTNTKMRFRKKLYFTFYPISRIINKILGGK